MINLSGVIPINGIEYNSNGKPRYQIIGESYETYHM